MKSDSSENTSALWTILNVSSRGIAVSSKVADTKIGIAPGDQRHMNIAVEIGLLLLLSLIWGSSFTLIKVAADTVPPLTMTAARVTIAALLLVLFVKMRGLSLPRTGATWAAFFVPGLLQSALPFTLISWGEQHIASGLAGVLNATPPMFVLLVAMTTAYGGQRITMQKIAGVVVGLAGVVITIGFQSLGQANTAALLAQAAVLGASLCYALAPMWGRRFAGLPAIVTAAGAMSCAAIMILPAAIIIERPWTLAPTAEATIAVLVLAVLCTAFAMIIYFRLVQTLGPLGTTSGSYLRAGFAVALGIFFLGESFTWSILIGMTLIVLGVIAVTAPLRWPWSKG
jgi:drug/metabolite transporter (DMT)-like permease